MKQKYTTTILIVILLLSGSAYAQRAGKVGLSTSIQNADFGIQVPVWVSEKVQLAPGIAATYAQDQGTDLQFGLTARFYRKTEEFSPYAGLMAGTAYFMQAEDDPLIDAPEAINDLMLGILFGGEYFFMPEFSIGIEAQGNFTMSDEDSWRFGNPGGTNFNLGTALRASIYF